MIAAAAAVAAAAADWDRFLEFGSRSFANKKLMCLFSHI